MSVTSGIFSEATLVPLRGHSFDGEDVTLAFDKDRIQDAPVTDEDGHLTEHDRESLYRHYGLESAVDQVTYDFGNTVEETPVETQVSDRDVAEVPTVAAGDANIAGTVNDSSIVSDDVVTDAPQVGFVPAAYESDESAPVRGEVRDELVLSEEQLRVEKERVEAGEARIQKYVVTEMQTIEVPVTREEVRIVREPIAEEDRVKYEGASLGDQEASVVLYEERVVVSKVTVPVERVSLRTETVEETKVVEETVARERLETEGPVTGGVEAGQVRGDEGTGLNLSDLDFS